MHHKSAVNNTNSRVSTPAARSTAGFTLMELIVVIVILGILLATGTVAWAQWHKSAMFRKNEEYAQSLFAAAQSSLAHCKANGQLEELAKKLENGTIPESGKVPEDIALHAWEDSDGADGSGSSEKRELYYLDFTKENYESADFDQTENIENQLFRLLADYVHDSSVFDAAIRVEFDPRDGSVFSVCYSDRADKFDYSAEGGGSGGTMGVAYENREEGRRRDILLGYYESGVLSAPVPDGFPEPDIAGVELVNDETLHAEIKLKKKCRIYAGNYAYKIQVFDAKTDEELFDFTINSEFKDEIGMSALLQGKSKTEVTFRDGSKKELVIGSFLEDGAVCVVLDGTDLAAAERCDEYIKKNGFLIFEDFNSPVFDDTYSAMRFKLGIEDKIYVKATAMSASKTSDARQSNAEYALMGTGSEMDSHMPEVSNARHLFNVRFFEDFTNTNIGWNFVQSADISWGGEDGLISHGFLYDSRTKEGAPGPAVGTAVAASEWNTAAFPPISQFGRVHIYTAKKDSVMTAEPASYAINYFTVLETELPENDSNVIDPKIVYAAGLFRENLGTISDLIFVEPAIQGVDYVGTLCGYNEGIIRNISVLKEKGAKTENRDYVCGRRFVGGISGYTKTGTLQGGSDKKISGMVNEMHVYGRSFVGGIMGCGNGSGTDFVLSDCRNSGLVEAGNIVIDGVGQSSEKPEDYCYFGGIAGYCSDSTIESCTSASGSETYEDLIIETELTEKDFKGDCVGGIVGAAANVNLKNCSTGFDAETGNAGGILTGRKYVGGIAGFWNGGTLDGTQTDGSLGTNGAVVVAWQYAGGIVGANSAAVTETIKLDGQKETITVSRPKEGNLPGCETGAALSSEQSLGVIENWKNEAAILSSDKFSGGIAGWNTGKISDCSSKIAVPADRQVALQQKFMAAETAGNPSGYIGGLAGYNNGTISVTAKIELTPYLVGHRFVGGIVGYNDKQGEFSTEFISVNGGILEADVAAGGIAGLNRSAGLFTSKAVKETQAKIAPELINAVWCAGGLYGVNLLDNVDYAYLSCQENAKIVTSFKKGEEGAAAGGFTGGLIGYHGMKNDSTEILKILTALQRTDSQDKVVNSLTEGKVKSAGTLLIMGTDGSAAEEVGGTEGNPNVIAGGSFVGGCIGYQGSLDGLTVRNVNMTCTVAGNTPLSVKASEGYRILQKDAASAIVGGLVGIAGKNTEIENCVIKGNIYAPKSDYAGGVAAFNFGKITNTDMEAAVGAGSDEYGGMAKSAGGIAGWNEGSIVGSTLKEGASVTAANMAGGIVAENYGSVEPDGKGGNLLVDGNVTTGGQQAVCMGGVTAFNGEGGSIKGFTVAAVDGGFPSGADKTGGIAGWNRGNIVDCRNDRDLRLDQEYVGGIAGYVDNNSDTVIDGCINTGTIRGGEYRAGIAACKTGEGNLSINRCHNYGRVEDNKSLWGIIAGREEGSVTLSDCFGISDIAYPLTDLPEEDGKIMIRNSYYFDYTRKHNEEELTAYINGSVEKERKNSLRLLMDNDRQESYFSDSQKEVYVFTFSKNSDLSHIMVNWTGDRGFSYRLRTAGEDGKWNKEIIEGTGSSDGNDGSISFEKRTDIRKAELEISSETGISISEIIFDNGAKPAEEPGEGCGGGIPLITVDDGETVVKSRHPSTTIIKKLPASPYGWGDTMSNLCDKIDPFLQVGDSDKDKELKKPKPLKAESAEEDNRISLSWENGESFAPSGYEVRLEILKDKNDKEAVDTRYYRIQKGTELDLSIQEEWKGYYAGMAVRALDFEKEELDSDWSDFEMVIIPGERKLKVPELTIKPEISNGGKEGESFSDSIVDEKPVKRQVTYQTLSWKSSEEAESYEIVLTPVYGQSSRKITITKNDNNEWEGLNSIVLGMYKAVLEPDGADGAENEEKPKNKLMKSSLTYDEAAREFHLCLPDAKIERNDLQEPDGYTDQVIYWYTASVTVQAKSKENGKEITSDRAQWILLEYGLENSNDFRSDEDVNFRTLKDGVQWNDWDEKQGGDPGYVVVTQREGPVRLTASTPMLLGDDGEGIAAGDSVSENSVEPETEILPTETIETETESTQPEATETETEGTLPEATETESEGMPPGMTETETEGTLPEATETEPEGTPPEATETETEGTLPEATETETEGTLSEATETETEGMLPEATGTETESLPPTTGDTQAGTGAAVRP